MPLLGQPAPWLQVPAREGAPAFRCRVRELLADPDHGGEDCQASMRSFLEQAAGVLQRLPDCDPFCQSLWVFEAGGTELQACPIRAPWPLALGTPWAIGPQLSQDRALLLKLAGGTGQGAFLASKDGYRLAEPGEVRTVRCCGYEGTCHCPDRWKPMPAPVVQGPRPLSPGVQVAGLGPTLALRVEGRDWTLVNPAGHRSSAGRGGISTSSPRAPGPPDRAAAAACAAPVRRPTSCGST